MTKNPESLLPPGFRFHPTDEELILHYLKNKATSNPCPVSIIAEVDIYKFDPWDLPGFQSKTSISSVFFGSLLLVLHLGFCFSFMCLCLCGVMGLWLCRFFDQLKQLLERRSGTFSPQETGSTRTALARIGRPRRGIGRRQGPISRYYRPSGRKT